VATCNFCMLIGSKDINMNNTALKTETQWINFYRDRGPVNHVAFLTDPANYDDVAISVKLI